MDIIHHFMPLTWKNKIIEQGFNNTDSTVEKMSGFFETRVENLEPKEAKKKSSAATKKSLKKNQKRKREHSNSSAVEFSKESTEARRPNKKYCILDGKCSHYTDSYKDLRAMVNKHKKKKKKNFSNNGKSIKELNAQMKKKCQKFVKNKKRRKLEKELLYIQEMQISDDEIKKSVESREISSYNTEWKIDSDELFVTCLNWDSENKIGKPIKNYFDLTCL